MINTFICNYNAGKFLHNTFDALRKCDRKNTAIRLIDNASIDFSELLIAKEIDEMCTTDPVLTTANFKRNNIGKSKAINEEVKKFSDCTIINKSDLIFSMDSDLQILNPNFFTEVERIWNLVHNRVSCLVCWQEGNSLYKREICFYDSGKGFNYFVPKEGYGHGIAGGGIITNKENWDLVGGYRENCGLFGGDDGFLMLDLYNKTNKPICVIKELNVFHPFNDDIKYRAWKDKCLTQQVQLGKCIEEKGFYD